MPDPTEAPDVPDVPDASSQALSSSSVIDLVSDNEESLSPKQRRKQSIKKIRKC